MLTLQFIGHDCKLSKSPLMHYVQIIIVSCYFAPVLPLGNVKPLSLKDAPLISKIVWHELESKLCVSESIYSE